LDDQDRFLNRLGLTPDFIPYNSDNRRNVGYLMALEDHSDFLISIDDDNWCRGDSDYFGEHEYGLFGTVKSEVSSGPARFLNPIHPMGWYGTSCPVYARGFPYFARFVDGESQVSAVSPNAPIDVAISAGLWLRDPDVDAMTWLSAKPRLDSVVSQIEVNAIDGGRVVLGDTMWAPVNSQNTAIARKLIPSYYFLRMGYPIKGTRVGRMGDIFSGYFALACAKAVGCSACFGKPLVDHRRNSHDYLNDLSSELPAIMMLDNILPWLIDLKLDSSDVGSAYLSLSDSLDSQAERFSGSVWDDATRGFIHQMAYLMRVWLDAVRRIG
jgi:hypothetical protein